MIFDFGIYPRPHGPGPAHQNHGNTEPHSNTFDLAVHRRLRRSPSKMGSSRHGFLLMMDLSNTVHLVPQQFARAIYPRVQSSSTMLWSAPPRRRLPSFRAACHPRSDMGRRYVLICFPRGDKILMLNLHGIFYHPSSFGGSMGSLTPASRCFFRNSVVLKNTKAKVAARRMVLKRSCPSGGILDASMLKFWRPGNFPLSSLRATRKPVFISCQSGIGLGRF